MKTTYTKLCFYPFSGLNSSDFFEIINLYKRADEKLALTLIYSDILDYSSFNEFHNFALFFNDLGLNDFKLKQTTSTEFEHHVAPEKIELFKKLSKVDNPNYGWSENTQLQSSHFSIEKDDISVDFIFIKNDAFNCLDFLDNSGFGELSIVLKYPGAHLNNEGLTILNQLFNNVQYLKNIYTHVDNEMAVPDSLEFKSQINNFNLYHNKKFNQDLTNRLMGVLDSLKYV
jgi:hypothetical protein